MCAKRMLDVDQFLKEVVHERGGLVKSLTPLVPAPGGPQFHRYLALIQHVQPNGEPFVVSGSGFSDDEPSAKMAAVGEAIERYSSRIINWDELLHSSFAEITKHSFDPTLFTRLEADDYAHVSSLQDVTHNSQLYWTNAINLATQKEIWLPFETIYLQTPPYKPFRDIISTGLACGTLFNDAALGAFCECIERDAFVLFWMLGQVRGRIRPETLSDPKIQALLKLADQANVMLELYDITSDLEIPTFLTLVRKPGQPGFYMGCATHADWRSAIRKSILEGLGGFSIYTEALYLHGKEAPERVQDIWTLDDHVLYYLSGHDDKILDQLLPYSLPDLQVGDFSYEMKTLDEMVQLLSTFGHPVFIKDLTTIDVKTIGMFVVRVVCPTLCFLPVGGPMLNCARLQATRDVLRREFNLAPHPFP